MSAEAQSGSAIESAEMADTARKESRAKSSRIIVKANRNIPNMRLIPPTNCSLPIVICVLTYAFKSVWT